MDFLHVHSFWGMLFKMHTFAALLALSCCLKRQLYSSFKMQYRRRQCQSFTLRSSNIWTSSMSTLSGVCSSRRTQLLLCLHWAAVMTSSTTAMARCDVDGVNGKSSHHIQPLQQCWITGQHMKQAKQHILCHGRDDLLNVHWWCALMLDSVWTHFSLCCICHQNFDQTDMNISSVSSQACFTSCVLLLKLCSLLAPGKTL